MRINKEVQVELEGKIYNCKGTFELIERIEQRVNIVTFENSIALQKPKITDIAWIIYSAISFDGYGKSYRDVGGEILTDLKTYIVIASNLINACMPEPQESQGEEADKDIKKKS